MEKFLKIKKLKSKLIIGAILLVAFNCTAQYTKLYDFDSINGRLPRCTLFSYGSFLYGITNNGGLHDDGVIFKLMPDGTSFTKLHDFISNSTDGYDPEGSLISVDSFLFGMTTAGGFNNMGTIFKIKPDGTGYLKIFDFTGYPNGGYPGGSLIFDGTFLYGVTVSEGLYFQGSIFKIKPDGTGYVNIYNFGGTTTDGKGANSLITDGTFLYGTTYSGGTNDLGIIYKIKLDGTGYSNFFNFSGSLNGRHPSNLYYDGTFLYGTTASGGSNNYGTSYKVKPDGTGYLMLVDFTGGIIGGCPFGSLFYDGTYVYGGTGCGGANNKGIVYKIKADGTGNAKIIDYDGTNGTSSWGNFISIGNFLYGTTVSGGISNNGTIFKIDISTGIKENNLTYNIFISPNPTNGIFTISAENLKMESVTIYNVLGEIVYQLPNFQINTSSNFQIDLTNQPNGIYFINLKTEQGIVSKKIIINK